MANTTLLNSLSPVQIDTPTQGQTVAYDATAQAWKNHTVAVVPDTVSFAASSPLTLTEDPTDTFTVALPTTATPQLAGVGIGTPGLVGGIELLSAGAADTTIYPGQIALTDLSGSGATSTFAYSGISVPFVGTDRLGGNAGTAIDGSTAELQLSGVGIGTPGVPGFLTLDDETTRPATMGIEAGDLHITTSHGVISLISEEEGIALVTVTGVTASVNDGVDRATFQLLASQGVWSQNDVEGAQKANVTLNGDGLVGIYGSGSFQILEIAKVGGGPAWEFNTDGSTDFPDDIRTTGSVFASSYTATALPSSDAGLTAGQFYHTDGAVMVKL